MSQWVWNLRLKLGHQLAPEPLRMTEFAVAHLSTADQQTLSRAQRAHYRLCWQERLARNARAPTAGRITLKLFGIPEDVATSLGLAAA